MNRQNYDFAVIGGDMRQFFITEQLIDEGYRVCQYALCEKSEKAFSADCIEDAVSSAFSVIAPIPLMRNKLINHQMGEMNLIPDKLTASLQEGQYFFAGNIPAFFKDTLSAKGVRVFDLMNDEELTLYNSIATAEGAICEAIAESSKNLSHSPCLVLGYGKCGKSLATYLKGLFCEVTVCARNPRARAEAEIVTDGTIDMKKLKDSIGHFSFIFNTIPSVLLTHELLEKIQPDALIIDIASAPGGVDYDAAEKLHLAAHLVPQLPGRYSPVSSANAILRSVKSNLPFIRKEF